MFNGLRRDDVIDLKKDLEKLGFLTFNNPTNLYGPKTARGVKDFQKYYGLPENSQVDEVTLSKISELLSSPFQSGKSHKDTIKLKKDLDKLGYKVFTNPTAFYGSQTEGIVKEFQSKYELPISGIADSKTLAKIEELLDGPMFNGLRRDDVIDLKKDLEKLGFLTFNNPTNLYGPKTARGVKDFQKYYGLPENSQVDEVTLSKISELLSSPFQSGKSHKDTIKLKKDLDKLGYKVFTNPTAFYGSQTEGIVKEFQSKYELPISGIADSKTLAKIEELLDGPMFN